MALAADDHFGEDWVQIQTIEVSKMFSRILIAVDGSSYSEPAVAATVDIATKFQSQVFVLHVREQEYGRVGAYPLETPQEAIQLMTETIKAFRDAGITVKGDVHGTIAAHIAKDIVDTATTEGSDLLIMGSRGLSDIASMFVGSVTHKVLQLAHIPVLVVKQPKAPVEKRVPVAAAATGPIS